MRDLNLLNALKAEADVCARCGYCKTVCPTYEHSDGFEPSSPRARLYFIKEWLAGKAEMTPEWADRIYRCTTCERCMSVCQTMIPLVPLWKAARTKIVEAGMGPMPAHKKFAEAVHANGNTFNEPIDKQRDWMTDDLKPADRADILVFGGCTASFRMPAMLKTGVTILQKVGIPYMYLGGSEHCCGSPLLATGQEEVAVETMRWNMQLVKEAGVKKIVAPCGGCSKTLKLDYPTWAKKLDESWDVRVIHFSELYADLIRQGKIRPGKAIEKTVTYHDPCHVGRAQGIFEEPRTILSAIPGLKLVEMQHHGENSRCCGAGGGVKAAFNDLALMIGNDRIEEARATGAEVIATMCPFCQTNLSQAVKAADIDLPVVGVDALLLESLGSNDA